MNTFKVSGLRSFGTEQISFTADISSEKMSLSESEIKSLVDNLNTAIDNGFISAMDRGVNEKLISADYAEKSAANISKLNEALQKEVKAKEEAQKTMYNAEKVAIKVDKSKK